MKRREKIISRSIAYSVLHSEAKKASVLKRFPIYFYLYWLNLQCVRLDLFKTLRSVWAIDEVDYLNSFGAEGDGKDSLSPMGNMGFSGSTFFVTRDSRYLVKSIPRYFEHSFFRDDLLLPFAEYMQNTPSSLLSRITDLLQCAQHSIGSILGLAPSHHIVMENMLYGQERERDQQENEDVKWQSWDLKPMSYFYPERDIAGGALTSESTKGKLADTIDETICLTLDQAEEFKAQLEKDTALLARCNAVDYSLFLVRIPAASVPGPETTTSSTHYQDEPVPPAEPPFVPPAPPSWRTGVKSADGRYLYRAAILDFFWAKHKVHAKAMTGLINTYNIIDHQGPMSITTTSTEYRQRFLNMCYDTIESQSEAGPSASG